MSPCRRPAIVGKVPTAMSCQTEFPRALRHDEPRPSSVPCEVVQSKPESVDQDIYDVLAHHQQMERWKHQDLALEADRWATIFNEEFHLDVPEFSLTFERHSRKRLVAKGHAKSREWQTLDTSKH